MKRKLYPLETGHWKLLRLRYLSNKFQKRTVRVEYNQFRAQPFAGVLDPSLGASGTAFTAPPNAFTYQSGLVPGMVMQHDYAGDVFKLCQGGNNIQPFGLLANFVGGNLDELGDANTIGVWNGVGSTYTVLAPAFNDGTGTTHSYTTNIVAGWPSVPQTSGNPTLLYAAGDGCLAALTSPGSNLPVAQFLERISASAIRVRLLV